MSDNKTQSLQEAIGYAAQQENEQRTKKILEIKLDFVERMTGSHYEKSQNYANFIMLAGYAAFFTILTNISGDLPADIRVKSATLMGFSCMTFVLWELLKMVFSSVYTRKCYLACAKSQTDEEYTKKLVALEKFENRYNAVTGSLWMFVLFITIPTGFYGAGILLAEGFKITYLN